MLHGSAYYKALFFRFQDTDAIGRVYGADKKGYYMGFLRFALAVLVMLSHMGIYYAGINQGVVAVVVFYLLAGHVVCRLWYRFPSERLWHKARCFYIDRLWRIAPLYVYALLVATLAWGLGADSYFLSRSPGVTDWLQNVLVVPLNFYMISGIDQFTLLPPAWSLAAEAQFYLLVPLLLARWPYAVLAGAASFGVFVLAQSGGLNTDVFGYRLLAGVLFVFLVGGLWQVRGLEGWMASARRGLLFGLWALIAAYTLALWAFFPDFRAPYNLEVALGFALGLPFLVALSQWRMPSALHRLQRLAGALSYGVFLLHFPVIWLLAELAPGLEQCVSAVLAGTTALAVIGHFAVERPLWARFRRVLG